MFPLEFSQTKLAQFAFRICALCTVLCLVVVLITGIMFDNNVNFLATVYVMLCILPLHPDI
jgi:hypothetical protein